MTQRPVTALVAEDHPAYLARVSAALSALGVAVVAANDGAQAIELLVSGAPIDLLVTDLDMPRENGWVVIDAWLARGRSAETVLMVTGEADSREVQRRCEAGRIRLIHKISLNAQFATAVQQVVAGIRTQATLSESE